MDSTPTKEIKCIKEYPIPGNIIFMEDGEVWLQFKRVQLLENSSNSSPNECQNERDLPSQDVSLDSKIDETPH
jgi:hypothetical protein